MLNKLQEYNKMWLAGIATPIADWLVQLADTALMKYLATDMPTGVEIALSAVIVMAVVKYGPANKEA